MWGEGEYDGSQCAWADMTGSERGETGGGREENSLLCQGKEFGPSWGWGAQGGFSGGKHPEQIRPGVCKENCNSMNNEKSGSGGQLVESCLAHSRGSKGS